jgi:hypothetical protein
LFVVCQRMDQIQFVSWHWVVVKVIHGLLFDRFRSLFLVVCFVLNIEITDLLEVFVIWIVL